MKFIQITDTHLIAPGKRLYDLDPYERLGQCIDDVNRHHGDAAFAIITGDLTHLGEPAAYQGLRVQLDRLKLPCHLLLGNHDNRVNFLDAFPESPRDANGFVQFGFDTPAGRFLCLDTNEPGVSWGTFCAKRLAWLERALAAAGDTPVLLFLHHPPFPVGLKRMDEISLRDPEPLTALLDGRRNIRHMFFGHLHRPIAGSWRGIPVSTMRATSHQVALDFVIEKVVPGSHEPPAYAVVFAEPDRVIVHFHDFLDRTATFNL